MNKLLWYWTNNIEIFWFGSAGLGVNKLRSVQAKSKVSLQICKIKWLILYPRPIPSCFKGLCWHSNEVVCSGMKVLFLEEMYYIYL